jgi:hypothetical protein
VSISSSKLIILHAKKHHFIDVMLMKRLGGQKRVKLASEALECNEIEGWRQITGNVLPHM